MLRGVGSVLAGMVCWTVLWLASNALLTTLFASHFNEDGSTASVGMLLLIWIDSLIFSVAAGYLTASLAGRNEMKYALALGIVQLAIGVFVQVQYWNVMPLWYHLLFLTMLLPGNLMGGKVRMNQRKAAVPV